MRFKRAPAGAVLNQCSFVEEGGTAVAAIVSPKDLEPMNQRDPQWEQGFEILDEIGAAFEGVDPEENERESEKALAEVRAEMRREGRDDSSFFSE
jgi:hypothetical protein